MAASDLQAEVTVAAPRQTVLRSKQGENQAKINLASFAAVLAVRLLNAFIFAQDPLYNDAPPNTNIFTPTVIPPGATFTPQPPSLQVDIDHESGWFYIKSWMARGKLIRSGSGPNATEYCLGNLSLALSSLGSLNGAEYGGAAGALSLLPTAGALIGSPTKELWVVYKLMPLAGLLSMFLSLGFLHLRRDDCDARIEGQKRYQQETEEERAVPVSPAKAFSNRVRERAGDHRGGSYRRVWIGVGIQAILIFVIILTLSYAQQGGVIVWWCGVWAWMLFWYFLVVVVSIIENAAGIPFTHNWTMRVTQSPHNIQISDDTPVVQGNQNEDVLHVIHRGFNVKSMVSLTGQEAYVKRNSCFYVVVSAEGVSAVHATFRVLSKGSSVVVFAFGTTIFASASLVSVSIVLMVLCLVLAAVVSDRSEAAKYVQEILDLPGLIVEIGELVIVEGRAIRQRNPWLSWSRYIGLLAAPFDVTKVAIPAYDNLGKTSNDTLSTSASSSSSPPNRLLGGVVMDPEDVIDTALNPKSYSTVDPEVRAYVYSLVSALGGTGADEDGNYILGDDALACLKDIKKWLKLYDEKANRLDVARCLAEANLVNGDLLQILAAWPEDATEDRLAGKIALACLELLVPLTWPIEKDETQMTVNHHRHVPYLQLAQTRYKRAIIQHDAAILRTAVRIGLPSLALPADERGSRDEGIIKLLLYFFRNVAMISAPPNLLVEGNESEVSRSATIETFHKQEVLALILTIASNIGEDFNTQDTVILEVLFHLLKGVNVEKLFMDREQRDASNTDKLKSLLKQEANMHRTYAKNAPTRHNRFGTMIWVERDNARGVSTVSGQDVLNSKEKTLSKMDQTKKWNKPKQRSKDTDPSSDRFDLPVPLNEAATRHLRSFLEEFLDSSFNPLFNHIRKAIEREADRILESHSQQFFYLISWFLEAERVRRRKKAEASKKNKPPAKLATDFEADSFALIASVLNQETFILLNRFMQDRLDMKSWRDIHAGTRCFTQILLIVQDMAKSPVEEDQEIAENIQNRIFYEETTHDRIIAILRDYKDQGFGYLDACTELAHVFLRMLERYSRENVDLQVRSRRKARKSKKAARAASVDGDADNASEMEDIAEAERVSRERKFDFARFAAKFMTQACVDTFVAFTKYYSELSAEQLKRAHRFFYRVAFKQELSVMLFRLDIVALFHRMIKGPEGLDSAGPVFREWEELVRQLIKRLVRKMQQRPELAVELLFSKIRSTVFYLEYGYEEQTITSKPRAPATLEVKGALSREEQIGVAVAVLYDHKIEHVDWVAKVLTDAASERQSWEAEAAARRLEAGADDDPEEGQDAPSRAPSIIVKPDTPDRAIAMFKDNKLRLLMTLSGFERLGIDDESGATWIIPSALSARELHETHDCIDRHRRDPIMQYGDEGDTMDAEDMLRRKVNTAAKQRRAEYDDDSDGDGIIDDGEEEFLFPAGGPVDDKTRKKDALKEMKSKRRRRRHAAGTDDEDGGLSDATREARRKARLEADREKRRKIKSNEFVGDSDDNDEADAEFFRKEEEMRKGQAGRVMEALRAGRVEKKAEGVQGVAKKEAKRKGDTLNAERGKRRKPSPERLDESDDDVMSLGGAGSSSPPAGRALSISSEDEATDTPLSSPHPTSSQTREHSDSSQDGIGRKVEAVTLSSKADVGEAARIESTDMDGRGTGSDEDQVVKRPSGRRKQRAVVSDDSD